MSSEPPPTDMADSPATAPPVAAGPARFDVFLSHNSADKPIIERIARALQQRGLAPWLDAWELTPGGDWQVELAAGLRASCACAVFVGPQGAGAWSAMEARLALDLAAKDAGFRVFAVLLPGVAEPFDPATLPPFLATYSWVDLRRGLEDEAALERLVQAICGQPAMATPPAAPASVPRGASAAPPSNLPVALTSFIGREREQAEVVALLGRAPLVTLTGAGGSGKTRLALIVAGKLLGEYPDGVWLVELAALVDPTLVPQTVAQALGLQEQLGQTPLQLLLTYLNHRRLLLVLDNAEHLVGACAELAVALLRTCPQLHLLVTSREALEVAGEVLYRVPSLTVPDLDHLPPPDQLGQYEAVQLFLERAQARRVDFTLSARNAQAVAQVCSRLDGIPLAIELAAARIGTLPVETIAARLDDRFRLLTTGPRTALPRQQTLRATLDWSYDLLSPPEQVLLRRLAVFAGGWTLDAVEEVCTGGAVAVGAILDLLSALVNKSLVLLEEVEGCPRYRLLETLRQYGRERLLAGGDTAAIQEEHAMYYLALAEQAAAARHGPQQTAWLDKLNSEQDNLRTALAWYRGETAVGRSVAPEQVERSLRLVVSLADFWFVRGRRREGLRWLEQVLEQSRDHPSRVRAKALADAAMVSLHTGDRQSGLAHGEDSIGLCRTLGDRFLLAIALDQQGGFLRGEWCGETRYLETYPKGTALLQEGLAIARALTDSWLLSFGLLTLAATADLAREEELAQAWVAAEEARLLYQQKEDLRGIGQAHRLLGWLALHDHDYTSARAEFTQARSALEAFGEPAGVAWVLSYLGDIAYDQATLAEAKALYEESVALYRTLDFDREHLARALCRLGDLALDEGDWLLARTRYAESLRAAREGGALPRIAAALEALGSLAVAHQQLQRAVTLLSAASAWRGHNGQPLPESKRAALTEMLASATEGLSPETQAAAWAEGRALPLDEAVALALEDTGAALQGSTRD
jgi:non-specific serine/threonine protein kinase